MPQAEYREYLYPPDSPRLSSIRGLAPYDYREVAKADPFTGGLIRGWKPLQLAEFRGVTEDGILRPEVHVREPARPGEEAPVAAMVAAARELTAALDEDGRTRLSHPVDAIEWQTWSNPEFLQFDTGIRLEFQSPEVSTTTAVSSSTTTPRSPSTSTPWSALPTGTTTAAPTCAPGGTDGPPERWSGSRPVQVRRSR